MRASLRDIAAAAATTSPKQALLDAAGDLSDYDIFHNLVLVATYVPPETTKGGIILADRTLDEDRFQGKVGLVLKVGPLAFVDDAKTQFGKKKVEPGDWVIYRPSDAQELFIRDRRQMNAGLPCRLIEDVFIKATVADPTLIY